MATVRDAITRAYRRTGLVPLGGAMTAAQAQEGLALFNEKLAELKDSASTDPTPLELPGGDFINGAADQDGNLINAGVLPALAPPYGLDDAKPFDDKYDFAIIGQVTLELADVNNIDLSDRYVRRVNLAWRSLLFDFIKAPSTQFDPAYRSIGRRPGVTRL